MRTKTQSSQCNSKHTFNNNKNKPNSKPVRQSSQAKIPIHPVFITTNTKNDVDVDKACIINNTENENIDLIKVMEMYSVNITQSVHEVATPCTSRLKSNRTFDNIDLQKELCKESEEESSTESIGKQQKI